MYGDEQAVARDHLPAIAAERDATLADPAADVLAPRRYGSRYYLPMLGLVSRPRAADLITELNASAAYVAWHESSELRVMHELSSRASAHRTD